MVMTLPVAAELRQDFLWFTRLPSTLSEPLAWSGASGSLASVYTRASTFTRALVYAHCCLPASMRTRRHPRPPHVDVDANAYARFLLLSYGLSALYTIAELALRLYSVFGFCLRCSLFGFRLCGSRACCSNMWAHMQYCGQASL